MLPLRQFYFFDNVNTWWTNALDIMYCNVPLIVSTCDGHKKKQEKKDEHDERTNVPIEKLDALS